MIEEYDDILDDLDAKGFDELGKNTENVLELESA